jgi:hypothetical protein
MRHAWRFVSECASSASLTHSRRPPACCAPARRYLRFFRAALCRGDMPPRPSAADAGESGGAGLAPASATALTSLPAPLVHDILRRLPADARARAACVCRAWRDTLLDPTVWTRLDVSHGAGGVTCRVDDAMLRAAAARAGGGLQALDARGQVFVDANHALSKPALLEVVAANAPTLRELALGDDVCSPFVEALARGAPQLHVFDVGVFGETRDLCSMLRREPPFGALRVARAYAYLGEDEDAGQARADTHALLAAVTSHAALTALQLTSFEFDLPAELDAVVAVVLSSRLQCLVVEGCGLTPASVPALARLLGGTALRTLEAYNNGEEDHPTLLDAPAAVLLAAALRANSTLTELTLAAVGIWRDETATPAAAALLAALTAHPSLRVLNLGANSCVPATAHVAGAALASLVAASAPALHELSAYHCSLGDTGLAPLFAALPHNTHLRALDCKHNGKSALFARDVLLPAVRANGSLRTLCVSINNEGEVIITEPTLEALRRCSSDEEVAQLLPWLNAA